VCSHQAQSTHSRATQAQSLTSHSCTSGSRDCTVRVWDIMIGQVELTLEGHSGSVFDVIFSPDGSKLASGSYDCTVRVWDVISNAVGALFYKVEARGK